MVIRVILKSGADFSFECEECKVSRDLTGKLNSLEYTNGSTGRPLYVDIDEITAIVRTS